MTERPIAIIHADVSLEDAVIRGVLLRDHDTKVRELEPDFAAFARGTIARRFELDKAGTPPSEAYAMAMADVGAYLSDLLAARGAIAALDTL